MAQSLAILLFESLIWPSGDAELEARTIMEHVEKFEQNHFL
jgi:hypothetical protein